MLTLDAMSIEQGEFCLAADLSVPEGGVTAIIGPSGAGKSTLLGAIAGFLPVNAGRILWRGTDITAAPPAARPVAVLFQDNNLFPHLTVARNVALALTQKRRLTAGERSGVDAALKRVGLTGLGARKPGTLSGGQQSRAALARVLLQNKPLIALDEPFSALGPALKSEMLDLVVEVAQSVAATVLMVTHDPRDAHRIAASAIEVSGGHAHPPRRTRDVLDTPSEAMAEYLGRAAQQR